MYIPSFYIPHAKESLTWRQHLHNAGAELLHFPLLHKNYDLIDAKTLERQRVTSTISAGKLFELIAKVLCAVTLVIPLICLAISYPTANMQSWSQVDMLFMQLEKEERKDFLYAFFTKKEIEKDAPFTALHFIAESYRNSNLTGDLISQLAHLDASAFEEVKEWEAAHETLYAEAELYVNQHNPKISVLFPLLTAVNQIRILQQLHSREKDLLTLFPLATTAALKNPGQLLKCLIPRELSVGDYGITLRGLPDLLHTDRHLKEKIPKTYQAVETLLGTLPQGSVLSVFWKIAKSIKPGIWEPGRKVTINNLSKEEKRAIQALPFEEVLILHKFEQPWTELWYQAGQCREGALIPSTHAPSGTYKSTETFAERLRQACFSLKHDNENSYRQEDNRRDFLDMLSHEDLQDLISCDPDCVELVKIFGNELEYVSDDSLRKELKLKGDRAELPYVLMRWWELYKEVDYKNRYDKLTTFYTNELFLLYFHENHKTYLETKPWTDAALKEWSELMERAREEIKARLEGRSSTYYSNFGSYTSKAKARIEEEEAGSQELSTFKEALTYLKLDSKRSYTQAEILREFRLWSLKHHPDKDKTNGAEERFKCGADHKDRVIQLLQSGRYASTPTW